MKCREPLPATAAAGAKAPVQLTSDASTVADRLREGALCEVVKIMDMPLELAPGYAVALIKALDPQDERTGLLLSSGPQPAAENSHAGMKACRTSR